jgi:hypothetical protein
MKKLFLLITLPMAYCTAQCQLDKGIWLVGGSGSFYNYHEDYNSQQTTFTAKYTEIDISASVGYFVADKLATGLRPTFSSAKGVAMQNGIPNGSSNDNKMAVGPFVRYYFLPMDRSFNLLSDVSYQWGITQRLGALHEKGKNNTFSIMAGPEVFFNSSAGLEILLGYSQNISSIENSLPEANSNINKKGLQISIGFQLHLEKN